MRIEKDLLLSLLKLTQKGAVSKESLAKSARLPARTTLNVLARLVRTGIISEYHGMVEALPRQRFEMAMRATRLGADFQKVCALLSWAEFEAIAAEAFTVSGYRVIRNCHFKSATRRWEIDILALKKPLVLCVDCKHWKRGWRRSAIIKASIAQTERTEAFAKSILGHHEKVGLDGWKEVTFMPIVLVLMPGPDKFCDHVPIVSILQVHEFISELPVHLPFLKHFDQKTTHIKTELQDFC